IAGVIELAMRLPGASRLGPLGEKPPIALPSRTPVPGIMTLDPNDADCVYVHDTAFPCASTTEKCVVSGDSCAPAATPAAPAACGSPPSGARAAEGVA